MGAIVFGRAYVEEAKTPPKAAAHFCVKRGKAKFGTIAVKSHADGEADSEAG
jgi:hypothetical protein